MNATIYEIIKEYDFHFDELDFIVKGKIFKELNSTDNYFFFKLSHNYKMQPDDSAVYIPGRSFAEDFKTAENLLFKYVKKFTAFDVTENTNY